MEYLKLFDDFEDIRKICRKYCILNYTINTDGTIDVDADVHLSRRGLTKLPLKFNHVSGNFWCGENELTTLEGSPQSVGGGFYCHNNQLTTLEFSPKSVVGDFWCIENDLTTLEGSPKSLNSDFYCSNNNLTTLMGGPKSVVGHFTCLDNKILTFEGAPNHVGRDFICDNNPIFNIWKLFRDYSKVELLNDLDPIRDGDILMDRFNTFLNMIGKDEVESVDGYNCIN